MNINFSFIQNFKRVFAIFRSEKKLILLSLCPIFLGVILYGSLGHYLFSQLYPVIRDIIQSYLSVDVGIAIINYILLGLMTILFFYLFNWTFILVVSLLSSPFFDAMVPIIAKAQNADLNRNLSLEEIEENKKRGWILKLIRTFKRDFKKLLLIFVLTILSMMISLFPVLFPVSVFLSGLLVAVGFLDYVWARQELSAGDAVGEMKRNFFFYGVSGIGFMFWLSVPGISLLGLPIAFVYFTIAHLRFSSTQQIEYR